MANETLKKYMMKEMTWKEAEEAFKIADVALIPVGTLEQHGYHMPLGVDQQVAESCAAELAKRYGRAIVYPMIPYGNSETMMDFPGTMSVSSKGLIDYASEVVDSVARTGIKKIIFVNGHGGNVWELAIVCKASRIRTGCIVASITPWDLASKKCGEIREQAAKGGVHACEIETSIALAAYELAGKLDLIDMSKAVDIEGKYPSEFVHIDITGGDCASLSWDMNQDWSPVGTIGDPSKATLEKGHQILDSFFENAIQLIGEMDRLVEGKWITKNKLERR